LDILEAKLVKPMSNQLKKVIFKTISYLKKQHDNQAEELIIELQAALQNIPESKKKDTEVLCSTVQ